MPPQIGEIQFETVSFRQSQYMERAALEVLSSMPGYEALEVGQNGV